MGTEGINCQQFTWELFACPWPCVEALNVSDHDLNIFTQDIPFNFVAKQALERLDNPGALAEVRWLRMHCARIPVYLELAQDVQELASAMHKFHKSFNDKAGQMVIHLEATKKRMEQARLCLHIQKALLELAWEKQLQGRFYWSGLLGMVKHSNRQYLPSLCKAHTVTVHRVDKGNQVSRGKNKQCCADHANESHTIQKVYNMCQLCKKTRHWVWECDAPHNGCQGPYCKLRHDHPRFYRQRCKFPQRQVGQCRENKCKHEKDIELPNKRWARDAIDVDTLIDQTDSVYLSD